MNIILTAINAKFIHSNLAVRVIYEYCREFKNHLSVMEFTINQHIDDIFAELAARKPDAVCFSCYIWNIEYVIKLSAALKLVFPDILIICGGPETSFDVKHTLSFSDIAVIGEGEEPMRQLLEYLTADRNSRDTLTSYATSIDGIAYLDENGTVIKNEPKPLDMAAVPFPYSEIPNNKILFYESSRGCPFHCQYCLSSTIRGVTFAPLEKVYDELSIFLRKNVTQVKFVDRTFNCNEKRALEIWKYLIENDNGITNFHFEIAAGLLTTEQLDLLKKARNKQFQFEIGVQSVNPIALTAVSRDTELEKLFYAVREIKKYGNIEIHLDLIAGLPNEGFDSFVHSFNEVYDLNPDQLQLGFLKLLKGSGLRANAGLHGIKYLPYPPYEVTETNAITFFELAELKRIESILNMYYNTNRYKAVLSYAVPFFESPFAFFSRFSQYWQEKSLHSVPQSKLGMFNILYEFLAHEIPGEPFAEMLKYDLYLSDNVRTAPYWAGADSKTADDDIPKRRLYENADFIAKYLPKMAGMDSSRINRVCNIISRDTGEKKYFLFDYSTIEKSTLNSNTTARVFDITEELK